MEIGSNLKKLRTSKGMTQKDLADSLNVSSQAVSRWENNEVEPDISTLSKLSSIFEVPVDAIINGNFEKKDDAKQEAEQAAVLAGTIAAAANKASEEQSKKIIEYCYDCHKPIYEGEEVRLLNRNFPDGHVETKHICVECHTKRTQNQTSEVKAVGSTSEHKVVGQCHACGKTIYSDEKYKEISVPATTSHRRGRTFHHGGYSRFYCERCNGLRERGKLNYDGSLPKVGKKRMIFGSIAGVLTTIITMIVFLKVTTMNPAGAVFLSLFLGYGMLSAIYCICTDCYINTLFIDLAPLSIKMPGIIFSFDLLIKYI